MHIIPLAQISKADLAHVGMKAWSLARLYAAHARVPEGFVITEEARAAFLDYNQLRPLIQAELGRLQVEELHSVEYASRVIADAWRASVFPQAIETEILQQFAHSNTTRVCVRSSAFTEAGLPDAFGQELRTDINEPADAMLASIKRCWASLFSPASLYIAASHHIDVMSISHALIIQRFIPADFAGLIYTSHPVHRDMNQIVIEAGYGLGDAIERGHIVPDTYTLTKKPLAILEKHIVAQATQLAGDEAEGTAMRPTITPDQQKLSDADIMALAKEAMRLEKKWDQPICMEWAKSDDWYFLQAREIELGI